MDVRIQSSSSVKFIGLKIGWTRPQTPAEHAGLAFADFNMAGREAVLPVLRSEYTGLRPAVGQWLQLRDEDGNSVKAKVVSLDDEVLWTEPLWESWISAGAFDGPREWVFETVEPPFQDVQWREAVGSGGEALLPA